MTDREYLELAAKAANVDVRLIKRRNTAVCEGDDYYEDLPEDRWYFVLKDFSQEWNPIADDGDALRLAVKCNLDIELQEDCVFVNGFEVQNHQLFEWHKDDPTSQPAEPLSGLRLRLVSPPHQKKQITADQ